MSQNMGFNADVSLRQAAQFSSQQTRLRELRPRELLENLPPFYQQEEKTLQQLESLDARFLENLRRFDERHGKAATPLTPVAEPEQTALQLELLQQKSKARIEKLKDIQTSLDIAQEGLKALQEGAHQTQVQLVNLIQSAQSQLTATYAGQTALSDHDGMASIRPFLVNLVEKLDCAQQHDHGHYAALCQAEPPLIARLKAPNAVLPLEKAILLMLGQSVDKVLDLYLTCTEGPVYPSAREGGNDSAETRLQMRLHQPSQHLLQRACRSLEEELRQLQAFHGHLSQLQDLSALRQIKGSLQDLRNRCLRELQGLQDVVHLHLPVLAPLLPLLRQQLQSLEQTCTPDFLCHRQPLSEAMQVPEIPDLPPALQPLLEQYVLLNHKVLVAFQALTVLSLEKGQRLEDPGG